MASKYLVVPQPEILCSCLGCGTGASSPSRQKWWYSRAVGKVEQTPCEALPENCVL